MSAFLDCLRRAVDAGSTTSERAKATEDAWRKQADMHAQHFDRRTAEEKAWEDVRDAFKRDTAIKRHERLAALRVMRRNESEVRGSTDLGEYVQGILERRPGTKEQFLSARFRQEAIMQTAAGMMGGFFKQIHTNVIGGFSRAQKAKLRDIGRELHGEGTGDQVAADMAKSIHNTLEYLRVRFNEAGGHIERLADWGLPHIHNWREIRKQGFDRWYDRIQGRLDYSRIQNNATGRPLSEYPESVRRSILKEIFDSGTRSVYAPVVDPRYGPAVFGQKFSDRHAHQRILHFKSFDDWIDYNEEFGGPDVFATITNHMRAMARDISLMETFGPNLRYGLEHRIQVARKEARKRDLASGGTANEDRVSSVEARARAMMDQLTGLSATPEGRTQEIVSSFFSNVRDFTRYTYLGSAVLASAGDFAATRMMAHVMGLNNRNVMQRYVQLLASSASREEMLRAGWVAETLLDHGAGMARFSSEVPGSEFSARLTGFVMRGQGLSFHTDMLRGAIRMEMAGHLAGNADRPLAEVDPELRNVLEERGITAEDWDAYRDPGALMKAGNGATFAPPHYWFQKTTIDRKRAERIATTMSAIIEENVELGVPSRSVFGDAIIQGTTRPGTFLGELALSGRNMKSFAISTWVNQSGNFMAQPTGWSRAAYLARAAAWFMAMGAISVQIKELVKGNDPRPMDSAGFAGAALMQGGGLGIVGDLLAQSETRFGGGFGGYIVGPSIGLIEQGANLTVGNAIQAFRGEETNAGRDLANFVRRNTPVASSFWPTRTAFDVMVADEIQRFLDPEAERSLRTRLANQERNFGNQSFVRGGEPRAPDLENALGRFAP